MLELLITILLAFGIKADPVEGRYAINQEVIQKIQSMPEYDKLGGDDALYLVSVPVDVDPKFKE